MIAVALSPVLDRAVESSPRQRGHLRLVPPDAAFGAASSVATSRPAVRLTVRGRRVLAVLVVVAILALGGAIAVAAGPGEPAPVTVKSGQTLSDIARTRLPDLPLATAVARIQLANGLNSLQVSAGQRLLIPAH